MNKFYYDLHLHSCLSPCGDNDMTPANIAGMAAVKMLDIVALTDHNTTRNCPAFYKACKSQGVIPIAGIELTTSEDVHIVCLFETLEKAMEFGEFVDTRRIRIKNKTEIFGDQLIMDENDEVIGTDDFLLPNATTLSIEEGYQEAVNRGAIVWPAHIDREANGIIATLGMLPSEPRFGVVEYRDAASVPDYESRFPELKEKKIVCSSDAHYLWDINERENFFELDDENYSGDLIRKRLFDYLRGE
ncbi:MAG: PHP domain-containing protein [Clostridiales bacterium]|nr:PHP domain-containing protein [Candidatus Coliplasma equi]